MRRPRSAPLLHQTSQLLARRRSAISPLVLQRGLLEIRRIDRKDLPARYLFAECLNGFAEYLKYVKPIRRWYRKHATENPYKVASQVYVGVLSQPQLYQEGNHRTGALIASGILLQNGCPPFVLTRQDALAYFNPSSEIKFTDKRMIIPRSVTARLL